MTAPHSPFPKRYQWSVSKRHPGAGAVHLDSQFCANLHRTLAQAEPTASSGAWALPSYNETRIIATTTRSNRNMVFGKHLLTHLCKSYTMDSEHLLTARTYPIIKVTREDEGTNRKIIKDSLIPSSLRTTKSVKQTRRNNYWKPEHLSQWVSEYESAWLCVMHWFYQRGGLVNSKRRERLKTKKQRRLCLVQQKTIP